MNEPRRSVPVVRGEDAGPAVGPAAGPTDGSVDRTADGWALPERLEETARRARRYFESARAPNTLRAYASDLADFETWCRVEAGGLSTLPASPETVALYISDMAGRGLKVSTIMRRMAAISQLHKEASLPSPALHEHVQDVLKGIKREHGSLQDGAAPILIGTLRRLVSAAERDGSLAGVRDRALLLVGLAGGFRRSELSAMLAEDLEFVEEGVRVLLRRSKTDPEGKGRKVGVPYGSHPETCPVRNVKRWLEVSGREAGPLFCQVDRHGNIKSGGITGRSVTRIVQKRAREAGLDGARYSAHSLRAGLVTGAALSGAADKKIMDQTGHKSVPMVHRYTRDSDLFKNNAAAYLGL